MSQILNFSNDYNGLSSEKAERNLETYGLNSVYAEDEYSSGVGKALINPRLFIMLGATVLSALTGNIGAFCAMLILTAGYIGITCYSQTRLSDRERALKRLSGIKFRTVRDGKLTLIRKEYLVPDDIIVLHAGECVPADAYLLEAQGLAVDESVITGSSTPVVKETGRDGGKTVPKKNCIYKNTLVLKGEAIARVFATGEDVVCDEKNLHEAPTAYETAVTRVTPYLNIAALAVLVISAVFSIVSSVGTDIMSSIAPSLLNACGFALCFTPPMLSMIVKGYYVRGAHRLSRKHALVKNLNSLEKLNAITCVCVEKSGTITKSHLEVASIFTSNDAMFTNVSVLACEKNPSNSVDSAILFNASFGGADIKELQSEELIASYPFSEENKMAGNIWRVNGTKILCVKGSPDVILAQCDLSASNMQSVSSRLTELTRDGQQVLAVAYRTFEEDDEIPSTLFGVVFSYIGLIGFTNSTRDTIPFAVKSCYKSGVDVIMTTGDSEDTAEAIARKIGLRDGRIITGEMLRRSKLYGEPLDLTDVNIFARVTPEQRREIVKMLRERGEIVATSGDDMEDVEVLRTADVGIAVSGGACPAATEACDLLMGDENFIAVVDAIKDCRQIHLNMKRSIKITLCAFTCLVLLSLVSLVTGTGFFTPQLSSLLLLVIVPACALLFLENSADPRSQYKSSGLIGKGKIDRSFFPDMLIRSASLFIGILIVFALSMGLDASVRRSLVFFMFSLGLTLQSLSLMSNTKTIPRLIKEKRSGFALMGAGLITLLTLLLTFIPFVNSAFSLGTPDLSVALIALLFTVLSNGWHEVAKYIKNKK